MLNVAAAFLAGGFARSKDWTPSTRWRPTRRAATTRPSCNSITRATYPKIVLKRGVTFNTDIWDWHHQVVAGKRKTRKSGTIIAARPAQAVRPPGERLPFEHFPVAAWTFYNALPEKLAGPVLDAATAKARGRDRDARAAPEKIERLSLSLIPGVADLNSALSGLIGIAGAAALAAGAAAGLAAACEERAMALVKATLTNVSVEGGRADPGDVQSRTLTPSPPTCSIRTSRCLACALPLLQFVRGEARTLAAELFLDQSNTGESLAEKLAELARFVTIDSELHAPPVCQFEWGDTSFLGVMSEFSEKFTMFDETGKILRARVTIKMKAYEPANLQYTEINRQSPDRTKTRAIRPATATI